MPDDIKAPSGGGPGKKKMNKKTTMLLVAGGGVALIALVYVYKKQSAANTSTAANAAATDPSIDPATGIPYADEQGGYSSPYGTTPSLYGYTDPSTGAYITGTGAPPGSVVTQPSTNASWAQEVEAYMQNLGYNPTDMAAAIGKYLTGQTLTANQQSMVEAALGFFGNPPQGAPPVSTTPPPGAGHGKPGEWVPLGGKLQAWWSANKDTLGGKKINLAKSGWYHVDGKKVFYNKNHDTFGYYIGKKWTTEKVT